MTDHYVENASWRKSTYSGMDNGQCLEVCDGFPGVLPVRDSKRADGPVLVIPAASWQAFIRSVQ
ncbi:hypothetical protein GCM10009716_36030 [Streptomyces sodiiphilus]|uniref:DUF397 domain-containing protein n=1 Tax=Streptomyces sodiiphilus TaxID=226217 RepID=A0ABP5B0D3_9ACTN